MDYTFNPNEHLMKIGQGEKAKDYLSVQFRLVWFRSICPQGTIDTEEIIVDLDRECEAEVSVWNAEKRRSEKIIKRAKGYARFKATISDGNGGRATGTGSECAADFLDYIEKAETKAIGRALAALGYGTAFVGDELNEGARIVDSPVERAQDTPLGELKQYIGTVWGFKAEDAEARWTAYKVHVLNAPVEDANLTLAQQAQLRGHSVNEEKRRKEKQQTKANGK